MFGGGIDRNFPEQLDTDIISVPSYVDEESYKQKMQPVMTAKVGLVVEKDTLFNKIIHTQYFQKHKDSILVVTVRSRLLQIALGQRIPRLRH